MSAFDFTSEKRKELSSFLEEKLANYYGNTRDIATGRHFQYKEVKDFVDSFDIDNPSNPEQVLEKVIEGLTKYAIHTPHPSYYGLFNPRPSFASIMADQISATYNPQLAGWSHAPFANEIERRCILTLGTKMGFDKKKIDGAFCSGGAESNLTALLCAINSQYPNHVSEGLRSIKSTPTIYVSSEAHHSIHKAVKITGLGINSIQTVKVDDHLKMDIEDLENHIKKDIEDGHIPLMIVATTGTTGAGAIDDVSEINKISKKYNAWLHVDAAYGAGLKVSSRYCDQLGDVYLADSLTVDIHKWFSVPMGASIIVVNNKSSLPQTFSMDTDYMPDDESDQIIEPYANSIQWSRRSIGLKFFMPLAIHGWEAFDKMITHQVELGNYLRDQLLSTGWEIRNNTPLPIVCFTHPKLEGKNENVIKLNERIIESGKAWCSTYPVQGEWCIRTCITNYASNRDDIDRYIKLINSLI